MTASFFSTLGQAVTAFEANTAVSSGGGMLLDNTAASLGGLKSAFIDNSAGYGPGGALFATNRASITIMASCLLQNNIANTYGGAVFASQSLFTVARAGRVDFRQNTCGNSGGAVFLTASAWISQGNASFTGESTC